MVWLVICVLVVIFFFLTLYSWLLRLKTDVDAEFVPHVPIQVYRDPGTGQKKNSTDNNSLLLLYLGCFKFSIYPSNQNIAAVKKPLRWLIDPSNSMSPKHSGGSQRWSSRTGPRVVNISHWSSSFSFRHSLQGLATANHLLPSNPVLCISHQVTSCHLSRLETQCIIYKGV